MTAAIGRRRGSASSVEEEVAVGKRSKRKKRPQKQRKDEKNSNTVSSYFGRQVRACGRKASFPALGSIGPKTLLFLFLSLHLPKDILSPLFLSAHFHAFFFPLCLFWLSTFRRTSERGRIEWSTVPGCGEKILGRKGLVCRKIVFPFFL